MHMIDSAIQQSKALIIDSNANSRSLMAAQLRDLGVGQVRQSTRVRDARVILEHTPYDIVLCDYHFEGTDQSGQDLLDELRREQLLPYSTVFVMVTGEATYAKVAEAAEAALDAYLLKPYTTASLAERIGHARHRKRVLKDIFEAIENKDFERAAGHCMQRFETRGQFWLYAARIGAELLLRLNRHADAQKLYEAIIEARTVPWARLGVARTELASGNVNAARRTLETLIGDMPDHADSYDVMGRVQMEQGEIAAALATYRQASNLTPGCLMRMQRAGSLAFYAGEREEAGKMLERTVANGLRSKLFDPLSLVLLGLLRFDSRDNKGLKYANDALLQCLERDSGSRRLQRFETIFIGLRKLQERRVGDALQMARQLSHQADQDESFDLEAASLLVALWIRLSGQEVQLEEMMPVLVRLGMRYCTTKSSTEIMLAMTEGNETVAEELRACHTRIFGMAETAMRHSMRGNALTAVQLLIQQGSETRNAKLIDMAGLVLKRHAEKIDSAEQLGEQIEQLRQRFVIPLGNNPGKLGTRNAGGMALRS